MENLQNKNIWKIVGIVIVVLIIAKIFVGGEPRGMMNYGNNPQISTISVSGKGEVVVKPDISTVSFGVTVENLDVAKAQTEAATKMNNIIDTLKKSGIDEKDIKTTNYSIYPRYDYAKVGMMYPSGRQVLSAYVISQNVEVKIRDISKAGDILSEVGKLGVTDVSGLNFSLDKSEAKQDEARNLAIEDAKAQAKVLAKSLGVKLVRITSFSENNYAPYYSAKVMAAPMMDSAGAPELPVGENKITSNVTITYEIR